MKRHTSLHIVILIYISSFLALGGYDILDAYLNLELEIDSSIAVSLIAIFAALLIGKK